MAEKIALMIKQGDIQYEKDIFSSVRQSKKIEAEKAKKGEFFSLNRIYKYFPVITGIPEISSKSFAITIKRNLLMRGKPQVKMVKTPERCKYQKIINHPYSIRGATQFGVVGNLGTGKSSLLNLTTAFQLARGMKVLTFNDRRFEARSLAGHGYYDYKGDFHPFELEVWLPNGYQFHKSKPIWDIYKNVSPHYYESTEEIYNSMRSGVVTIVYDDCFDKASRIRLLLDLLNKMAMEVDAKNVYQMLIHEFLRFVPESPTKEIYDLIQRLADLLLAQRKDNIGINTSFHIPSEIFFRVVQKFGYIGYKQPANRKNMSQAEEVAKHFSIDQINISKGGYFREHTIGYFPELPDVFRLVPQEDMWSYPRMEETESETGTTLSTTRDKLKNLRFKMIANLTEQGYNVKEISEILEVDTSYIHQLRRKMVASE